MPRSATKYECLRRCRATLDRGLGVILDPTAASNAFNPLWNLQEGTNADDKIVYQTGLPAKSGVGGGLAVSPGKLGVAVVSPPPDDAGNSVRAQRAIAAISRTPSGAIRWPQRHVSGGRNV
jgi:Glutaminase